MYRFSFFRRTAALFIAVFLFSTSPNLQAQSLLLNRNAANTFLIEILKPDFDSQELNASFITSSLMLSGRFSISKYFGIVGEIPFSHFGENFGRGIEANDNSLGNIYLGVELMSKASPFFVEIGGRLPTVSNSEDLSLSSASLTGFVTTFVERAEAFIPDTVPLNFAVNFNYKNDAGFVYRLRGVSTVWIATDEANETELFFQYNTYLGFENSIVTLLFGASGRLIATEKGLNFGERSTHHLGFSSSVSLGILRPGIFFQLPVDSGLSDLVNVVLGLSLGLDLK